MINPTKIRGAKYSIVVLTKVVVIEPDSTTAAGRLSGEVVFLPYERFCALTRHHNNLYCPTRDQAGLFAKGEIRQNVKFAAFWCVNKKVNILHFSRATFTPEEFLRS